MSNLLIIIAEKVL